MALAYQLFLLPDASSHQEAMKQVLGAYEYAYQTGEMVRILRKLINEKPNNFLGSNAQQIIKLLLQYIEADPPLYWQELLIAADNLLRAVVYEPSFSLELLAHIYRKRGFAYKRLGEYQHAIEDYDRAIELDPNYARAYASRGSAFRSLRDYKHAIDDYNRALEYKPNYLWAYAGRGQAYSLQKDYTHAIQDLNHAIKLEPNYGWAYFLRGFTHLWLRDSTQARADFIRSGELSSKDVNAHWMVEWSGMIDERPNVQMIERLEGIALLNPKHLWASVCRGTALWLSNRFEEALAILKQAITLNPEISDNYFWQGMTYISLAKHSAAMTALEKALELEMPPILLSPLHWFEQEKPDFYQKYVVPLFGNYDLL